MASDNLQTSFERLLESVRNQTLLNKLGLAMERIIKKRTREGVDVYGNRFQEYSEGHKTRRKRLNLQTEPVNLEMNTVDGMMHKLDSVIASDLSDVALIIDDPEKEQIASFHNVQGAGKSKVKRVFWGINEQEEKQLFDLFEEDISELIDNF